MDEKGTRCEAKSDAAKHWTQAFNPRLPPQLSAASYGLDATARVVPEATRLTGCTAREGRPERSSREPGDLPARVAHLPYGACGRADDRSGDDAEVLEVRRPAVAQAYHYETRELQITRRPRVTGALIVS